MPRVTLTKAELSTPQGKGLVALIQRIGEDADVTSDELRELLAAVEEGGAFCDLASSVFLRGVIHDILADGKIELYEAEQLRRGLARVLPKVMRDQFDDIFPPDPNANRPQWYFDPISDRQFSFLKDLGHPGPSKLSKGEASEAIQTLLNKRENPSLYDGVGPTERQLMLLRFWNRRELFTATRSQISDFIDSWYSGNPLRKIAWEMWKAEQGKPVTDPNDVPIGIGPDWLDFAKERIANDMETVRRQTEKKAPKHTAPTEIEEPVKRKSIGAFFARLFRG